METESNVQCLTYLNIQLFEDRLLLIEVKGFSEHAQAGVPKLAPVSGTGSKLNGGILELDFINQPIDDDMKKNVSFEIRTVIDIGTLQDELKGIKVNAVDNADILLLEKQPENAD
ncbi:MAG: hypothetical protein KQH67_07915 [Bacteroidetes bacterium]|nr:hypothetical protein [Bacteroidota bacterium]